MLICRNKQRIEAAKVRFLHGLKGVILGDWQQSEDTRNLFEVNKITDDIKEYQEGEVDKTDYRLTRRVCNYRPQGKQDLGRPQMRWFEHFV